MTLSNLLISLVKENSSEPKDILVPSMVSFLRESFPSVSEQQALAMSEKAYETAIC